MIRPIVKDEFFLSQKSNAAAKEDQQVITDLLDTIRAHGDSCVGMAANMIGVKKRIIVVRTGMIELVMVNPKITKKIKPYQTQEGCLCLKGMRSCNRYDSIDVEYLDKDFKKQKRSFQGYIAQIIQHEVDHCNGIVI